MITHGKAITAKRKRTQNDGPAKAQITVYVFVQSFLHSRSQASDLQRQRIELLFGSGAASTKRAGFEGLTSRMVDRERFFARKRVFLSNKRL